MLLSVRSGRLFLVFAMVATLPAVIVRAAVAELVPEAEVSMPKWAPAVDPKPLSDHVQKGLAWLVEHQLPGGGWGQGEEAASMHPGQPVADQPNVADTCTAGLALIRAGSTPSKGDHAMNIRRAAEYICGEVEQSDPSSLRVTSLQGTRLQAKLGTYIDTFLAAMFLSEVKDRMPDEAGNQRVQAAIAKVMDKIEKNQQQDGSWQNQGWAPALAQSMASKAINRAVQAGAPVDETVRGRAEKYARDQFDDKEGRFASGGSAGVELYAYAASLGGMQDSVNTNVSMENALRKDATDADDDARRQAAERKLVEFEEAQSELGEARKAVVERLGDEKFMAGFGSNGGEEFLSYMNIGESLVVQGGPEWEQWDRKITGNLNRIQNPDGSWTGHHCITGRTFCTSAALLVLTVDRAPVPLAAKVRRR